MKITFVKMSKRCLTLVLVLSFFIMVGTTAFAAPASSDLSPNPDASPSPANALSDEVVEYDVANVDILYESQVRGSSAPTRLYDLTISNYSVSASWIYRVYTNYYFSPNSDGKIHWNFSVELEDAYVTQSEFTVECWDKTTGTKVTSTSFYPQLQPNGLYGLYIDTGNWNTYNLDTTHKYYFVFIKTNDATTANMTGTIKH